MAVFHPSVLWRSAFRTVKSGPVPPCLGTADSENLFYVLATTLPNPSASRIVENAFAKKAPTFKRETGEGGDDNPISLIRAQLAQCTSLRTPIRAGPAKI